MFVDQERLVKAALEAGTSPLSIEEGVSLAEHWIERGVGRDWSIVAVECGFVLWLDEKTVIVGVQDLLTRESISPGGRVTDRSSEADEQQPVAGAGAGSQIVGNEWKTTKEASKWWNEDKWLESITEGSQICIYALALQGGTYYPKIGDPIKPAVASPRIRVKAISKSTPPCIWPRRDEDGIITFSEARLQNMRDALLSEAESIRARRNKVGLNATWRVPGIWCTNMFRRVCEHHEACVGQKPATPISAFDVNDPAFKLAIPHIDKIDNDLVILSASSYGRACECIEAYRRGLASGEKEQSMALDTGTVFHGVVACYFQQIKEHQDGKTTNSIER